MTSDWAENWEDRKKILEAILVSALPESRDNFLFPTMEQYILSELVNGTIEYAEGNAGQITFQKCSDRRGFERDIWDYYHREMAYPKRELDPRVLEAVTKMVVPEMPPCPFKSPELYPQFSGSPGQAGIPPFLMSLVFSLPSEFVSRVKREVFPLFSDSEERDIRGIGRCMRKYIRQDVEFIDRTCRGRTHLSLT